MLEPKGISSVTPPETVTVVPPLGETAFVCKSANNTDCPIVSEAAAS